MTTMHSARREIRTLGFGVAAVALILVAGRGLSAWAAWQNETQVRASVRRIELARARASVRDTSVVRDTLARRAERVARLSAAMIPGRTPAAGAGALVSLVTDAATDAGMRVAAIQTRTDSLRAGSHARVGVRADLVGDIDGLATLLQELEGGKVMLAIRELDINQPEPETGPDRPEALRVQLHVEGLVVVPPAAPAPAPAQRAKDDR